MGDGILDYSRHFARNHRRDLWSDTIPMYEAEDDPTTSEDDGDDEDPQSSTIHQSLASIFPPDGTSTRQSPPTTSKAPTSSSQGRSTRSQSCLAPVLPWQPSTDSLATAFPLDTGPTVIRPTVTGPQPAAAASVTRPPATGPQHCAQPAVASKKKQYLCPQCTQCFTAKSAVIKHVKAKHPPSPPKRSFAHSMYDSSEPHEQALRQQTRDAKDKRSQAREQAREQAHRHQTRDAQPRVTSHPHTESTPVPTGPPVDVVPANLIPLAPHLDDEVDEDIVPAKPKDI